MKTLTGKEAARFLAQRGKRDSAPHDMRGQILHWPYCKRCGLIALKNERTARALRKPCVIEV